jgi:hypothetical protein
MSKAADIEALVFLFIVVGLLSLIPLAACGVISW